MMHEQRFMIRAATYLMLMKDGQVLLSRRHNVSWRSGEYTLVSGHIDGNETPRATMCREAEEEAGITIHPDNLRFVHVMYQYESHEYIDFYFTAEQWEGEPVNKEPERCSDLRWFPLDNLPPNIVPNVRQALEAHAAKQAYSELVSR